METLQATIGRIDLSKYQELFDYQAPFLEEKLFKSGKVKSKEEYDAAFQELKKYFILNEKCKKPLGMASKIIDEVWHQFILFTRDYHVFCNNYFGKYIHHMPNTSFTPIGNTSNDDFIDCYLTEFGEIPKIWGITINECSTEGGGCNGCNTCSQGQRTKKYNSISSLGCKECNGCGTGTPSCEP